jgi:hypothetical protein
MFSGKIENVGKPTRRKMYQTLALRYLFDNAARKPG